MPEDVTFDRDLYRGTAHDYDRYRLGYPATMIDDLANRAGVTGRGWLIDLACGTGQIAFAMADRFSEVWAVDQEPGMIDVVRRKAASSDVRVHAHVSSAERFDAPAASFELITVGNAFHRVKRAAVARNVLGWLQPGACFALAWSGMAWHGAGPWQQAMAATLDRWLAATGASSRTPVGWDDARREVPDRAVLESAGFEPRGTHAFPTRHAWTVEALIGLVYSTSFLPRTALGEQAPAFEADLRDALNAADPAGRFEETIDFAYELARRPL